MLAPNLSKIATTTTANTAVAEASNLTELTTQVHQGVPQPTIVNSTQERTNSVENEVNLVDFQNPESPPHTAY